MDATVTVAWRASVVLLEVPEMVITASPLPEAGLTVIQDSEAVTVQAVLALTETLTPVPFPDSSTVLGDTVRYWTILPLCSTVTTALTPWLSNVIVAVRVFSVSFTSTVGVTVSSPAPEYLSRVSHEADDVAVQEPLEVTTMPAGSSLPVSDARTVWAETEMTASKPAWPTTISRAVSPP